MASQGPNFAGTGSGGWTSPENITAEDGSVATTPGLAAGPNQSPTLSASNFGFSIPTGATIDGIVAEVKHFSGATNGARDALAILVKSGTEVGDNKSTASTFFATSTWKSFGSSTDLWGTTWTPSDINSSTFGFDYAVQSYVVFPSDPARVDAVRITVYYTAGSTTYSQTLTASATSTPSIVRSTNTTRSASISVSVALTRVISATRATSVAASSTLTKTLMRTLTTAVSALSSFTQSNTAHTVTQLTLNATVSTSAAITRFTKHKLAVVINAVASVSNSLSEIFKAPGFVYLNESSEQIILVDQLSDSVEIEDQLP